MIPLARVRYSQSFLDEVYRLTGSFGPVLRKAELSESLLEQRFGFTTVWQLEQVVTESTYYTDNLDIGWEAASNTRLEDHGSFSNSLFSKETLFERLLTFCRLAAEEYSSADFRIAQNDESIYFIREPIAGNPIAARQTELYVVVMMLATIRSVLGSKWQPRYVALQTFRRDETERNFDPAITELHFGQPRTIIAIDRNISIRSVDSASEIPKISSQASVNTDLSGTVRKILSNYLGDRRLNLEFIARIGDIHPRTLQRQLRREGTSYGEIVRRERLSYAARLLRQTNIDLTEISNMLGYSNQAHFSRAFRQFSGVTPTAYRRAPRN